MGRKALAFLIKMYIMKIFVSFDYENDRQYKYMLNAWSVNSNIEFTFNDASTGEINSWDIAAIKRTLSRKINEADAVLVIVGEHANSLHKDHIAIGYRNWQNYEIAKAKELDKKIIAVKVDRFYTSPEELYNCGAVWANSFTLDSIKQAIHKAQYGW